MTIVKLSDQHEVVQTPFCGELREVLRGAEYPPLDIAIAVDIGPTVPHFHRGFDEIYFVMEGELTLQLHDPADGRTWEQKLGDNELCVITRGVHHGVMSASRRNRLCAICAPPFDPGDETISNVLPSPTRDPGFMTTRLSVAPTAVAPDGSDVRVLPSLGRGGMAQFELAPGETSTAVAHRTVEEIWLFLGGRGEMWRRLGAFEAIVPVDAGVSITIPVGTHFQFRSIGNEPLVAVAVTMGPWPGEGEAYQVEGPWAATVPAQGEHGS